MKPTVPIRLPTILLGVLVAVSVVYIFSLPVLVTGDGPAHVYYSGVLLDLLAGTGNYSDHYTVRSYLTPYAFTHYFLAFFDWICSGILGEKVLAAICVALFCFGVWRLARVVSRQEAWVPLLAVPFAFHRFLLAGFYNFSIGAGLALWSIAFWIRHYGRLTGWRSLALLALILGLFLTHPISLAVTVLFFGIHLTAHLAQTATTSDGSAVHRVLASVRQHRRQILHFALSLVAVLGVLPFLGSRDTSSSSATGLIGGLLSLWRMEGLMAHDAKTGMVIRVIFAGVAIFLALGAFWRLRRDDGRLLHGTLVLIAVLSFFAYSLLPEIVGSTGLFATRFAVFVVAFLIASAACYRLPTRVNTWLSILAFVLTFVALRDGARHYLPVCAMNRVLWEAPVLQPGAHGVILLEGANSPSGVHYWSCFWGPALYFYRSQTTMLENSFLNQPYLILEPREYRAYNAYQPNDMPEYLRQGLSEPGSVDMPARLDLLVSVDCSASNSDRPIASKVAEQYDLVRMPWSTPEYEFYATPGLQTRSIEDEPR